MDLPLILSVTLLLMLAVGVRDVLRPVRWLCRAVRRVLRRLGRIEQQLAADARRRERCGNETVKVGVQP